MNAARYTHRARLKPEAMPRLKNIGAAKPYRPTAGEGDNWPNPGPGLSTKTID
ncbi:MULTISPECIES: hypothetical protein [unclassified Streptomyces]|uniref:hypothetical protein n=1 Tax=unclassified Streptomyces TaxID=2593676 RepID=UPI0016614429|nr:MULTISPECIES: hypothetical protein [unclassified Streptomyces]